jgi:hypothetical protein
MKTLRAALALVVPAVCLVATSLASAQVLKGSSPAPFQTSIRLGKAVQLGDGSVLPAGSYDVRIHYAGQGNVAEFEFLRAGVVKGRQRGEARGVSGSGAKALPPSATQLKYEDPNLKVKSTGEVQDKSSQPSPQDKAQGTALKYETSAGKVAGVKGENQDKDHKSWTSPGQAQAFSWGAAGFGPGTQLKQTEGGGTLRLELDSSNSSAGIIAILKVVPAGAKGQLKQ